MSSNKILSSTFKVTLFTLFVKFLGLIKQTVLAAYCGATIETDVFFITTGAMVNFSTIIFSAISISLLSIHTDTLINCGREVANKLINEILMVFIPIAVALSLSFFTLSPYIAKVLAPAYGESELYIMSTYIGDMSIVFVVWCYFLTINVILETDKQFIQGKGQALFQNIFLIIGAVFLYPVFGMQVMLYAFLLSGILQCILVTWYARDRFKFVFGKFVLNDKLNKICRIAVPLFLGNAIYEVNAIVDGQIATGIGKGSASILNYGATIHDMVVGVIVTSFSTVLFSHFSTWIAEKQIDKVVISLKLTIEVLTIILFPIMMICIVLGDQLVEIFYGRGNFGSNEISLTYGVVICYSLGFIFQAARANITKVYYAFQDSRSPMINGILAIIINIALSILLSRIIGVAGIALATSISMAFVTFFLARGVRRYLPEFTLRDSYIEIIKGFFATIITSFLIYFLKYQLNFGVFIAFFIESILAISAYIIILYYMKTKCILWGIKILKNNKLYFKR